MPHHERHPRERDHTVGRHHSSRRRVAGASPQPPQGSAAHGEGEQQAQHRRTRRTTTVAGQRERRTDHEQPGQERGRESRHRLSSGLLRPTQQRFADEGEQQSEQQEPTGTGGPSAGAACRWRRATRASTTATAATAPSSTHPKRFTSPTLVGAARRSRPARARGTGSCRSGHGRGPPRLRWPG
ncbi:hypothetical protein V3N99_17345 [Dermatophilaceae bacterium Soc4.6]